RRKSGESSSDDRAPKSLVETQQSKLKSATPSSQSPSPPRQPLKKVDSTASNNDRVKLAVPPKQEIQKSKKVTRSPSDKSSSGSSSDSSSSSSESSGSSSESESDTDTKTNK
ncbi:unnamed protein product, partial [Rotaria socialis]